MATTPTGLPYPVGTDRVVDGDNAIRALAEAVHATAPNVNDFGIDLALGTQSLPANAFTTFCTLNAPAVPAGRFLVLAGVCASFVGPGAVAGYFRFLVNGVKWGDDLRSDLDTVGRPIVHTRVLTISAPGALKIETQYQSTSAITVQGSGTYIRALQL